MADWLLAGGAIYTSDRDDTFYPEGWLLIRDGAIAGLGPGAPPPPPPGATAMDLSGMVVLPGFTNCHTHLFMTLLRGVSDDAPLFRWLEEVRPHNLGMTEQGRRLSYELGWAESLRGGVTCACDCSRSYPDLALEVAEALGSRAVAGGMTMDQFFGNPTPSTLAAVQAATQSGLTGRSERGGTLRYSFGAHSPYNCSPELLKASKDFANRSGLDFHIHLAEAEAEVDFLRRRFGKSPVHYAYDLGLLDGNTVLDHCVWLDDVDIEVLTATGARVAHCPSSNAKLACGIARVPDMLAHGIPVGIATDSAVSNNRLDLFGELKLAVLLQRATTRRAEILLARQALRMATSEGARVAGLGLAMGSLERGMRADLMVMDLLLRRPTADGAAGAVVFAGGVEQVNKVMVNGDWVVDDGHLVRIDEKDLRRRVLHELAQGGDPVGKMA